MALARSPEFPLKTLTRLFRIFRREGNAQRPKEDLQPTPQATTLPEEPIPRTGLNDTVKLPRDDKGRVKGVISVFDEQHTPEKAFPHLLSRLESSSFPKKTSR